MMMIVSLTHLPFRLPQTSFQHHLPSFLTSLALQLPHQFLQPHRIHFHRQQPFQIYDFSVQLLSVFVASSPANLIISSNLFDLVTVRIMTHQVVVSHLTTKFIVWVLIDVQCLELSLINDQEFYSMFVYLVLV